MDTRIDLSIFKPFEVATTNTAKQGTNDTGHRFTSFAFLLRVARSCQSSDHAELLRHLSAPVLGYLECRRIHMRMYKDIIYTHKHYI